MTSEDERWAEARELMGEESSAAAGARLRRRQRMLWISVAALVLLGAAVGVVVRLLGHHHGSAAHQDHPVAGLVLSVLGLLLIVAGLIVSLRSGGLRAHLRSPMLVLSRQQRRSLVRQVMGREDAEPASLEVARHVAERLSMQSPGFPLLIGGLVLMTVTRLLGHPTPGRIAFEAVVLLILVSAAGFGLRQGRRARRFLAHHPA